MTKSDTGSVPDVEDLDAREAREVLRRLWNVGGATKKAVAEEIEHYLRAVDVDEVAGRVFTDLDRLTREDLFDRSGKTSHGYDHPAEVAWEMVEEIVWPYLGAVDRYWKVGTKDEAARCCLGVLIGIYDFEMESDSNFKEWAQDAPCEAFGWVRDEWSRKYRDKALSTRLQSELSERCPEWM